MPSRFHIPMSIVTRTGDKGQTGLFGGERVPKSSIRIAAYGTTDELNAILGVALAENSLPEKMVDQLLHVQRLLFKVGADLATPKLDQPNIRRIDDKDIQELEQWIHSLEELLPVLTRFILPSGSKVGALLHHARTVCRRAERHVVTLMEQESINTKVQIYLNRLSDYLFLAARMANKHAGAREVEV
ncbi:MAG: putative ATP:cob(I)alamin adenosyltransferase [Candidatus Peribacteria bacterium]|nr:putative ATP:cob(I)alamin adenosyltransferase [Candidatus Peribacteria bacterium]